MDTDIALGAARGDVDDGFALAALLCAHRAGSARLLGISTVSGNTSAARAKECAAKLCEIAGIEAPIVDGPAAAERLARLPEGTKILALGPLTNIARACRLDPGLPERVSLRVVGGNLSSRGFLPPLWPHEFNLTRDAGGARETLSAPWRRFLLFPLDVVCRMRADHERLVALARLSPLGGHLARGSLRWLARARRLRLSRSFPVWDLPAALQALGRVSPLVSRVKLRPHTARYFGNDKPVQAVCALVPADHWEAFETLLASTETF